jgi:hypothetical protein
VPSGANIEGFSLASTPDLIFERGHGFSRASPGADTSVNIEGPLPSKPGAELGAIIRTMMPGYFPASVFRSGAGATLPFQTISGIRPNVSS